MTATGRRSVGPVAELRRVDVEDLLYEDARLLDGWLLEEWLATLAPDVHYLVPATDHGAAHPEPTWALIDDDRRLLEGRVERLLGRRAHAETPRSRTRRLVSNVQVTARREDELDVAANFFVFKSRATGSASYVGRYDLTFCDSGAGPLMKRRHAILDQHALPSGSTVSVIL